MASRVFLLALCCTLAYADIRAKLSNNHGDTTDVLASWDKERCVFGSADYYLSYSSGNGSSQPVKTKDLSYTLQNFEFWTNYSLKLDAKCIATTTFTTTFYTGPGSPHPVSSVETEANATKAMVTITDADKLPHIPDKYELHYCVKGTDKCQTIPVVRNSHTQAIMTSSDTLEKLLPSTVYELNTTAIIGDKPNEYRSVPFTSNFTTATIALPSPSGISVDFDKYVSNGIDTTFKWKVDSTDDDAKIIQYNFTIFDNNNEVFKTGNANAMQIKVTALPVDSKMVFNISASYNVSDTNDPMFSSAANFSFKTPALPPNPVDKIKSVALSDTSEYVTWAAPKLTSIQQYNVTYCPWDASNKKCSKDALNAATSVTNIILSKLQADTQYNISVVALNDDNMPSKPTSVLAKTLEKDYKAPTAIKSVNSKNETDTAQFTISWTKPADHDATFFNVTTCFVDTCTEGTTKDLSLAVNVSYFVDFNVTVEACYDLEFNQRVCRSAETLNGTSVGKDVGSVEEITVASYTDTTIELQWKAPKDIPTIANKNLNVSYAISEPTTGIRKLVQDLHVVVDNLTVYTDYTFTIQPWIEYNGENFNGEGANKSYTTDAGIPGVMKTVTVVQEKSTTMIDIEWEAPEVKNGPIDFYGINVTRTDGTTLIYSTSFGSNRFTAALPSTNGENYTVAVHAGNYDQNGKALEGEPAQQNFTFMGVGTPVNASVVDYTSFELTIEVDAGADENNTDVYFKLEDLKTNKLGFISGGHKGTIGGLKPYSDQVINITSCLSPTFCGGTIQITGRTNVGPPSKVNDPKPSYFNVTNPSVTWKEPTTGNGPIDGYVVEVLQISEPGSKSVQYVLNRTQTNLTHNTTDEWETYDFTIYAYNDDERDEHKSEPILGEKTVVQVTTNGTTPPKPMDLQESNTTSSGTVIEWEAPEEDSRFNVTTYRVVLSSEEKKGSVRALFTSNTTVAFDTLAAYDNYTVEVSSCPKQVVDTCGKPRKILFATDAAAPEAPTDAKTGKVTKTSLEFKWSVPKQLNGPLNGYRVNIAKTDKKNDTWITLDRDASSYTFDGLDEGTKYTVLVLAYNVDSHKKTLEGKTSSSDGVTDSTPKKGGMSPWAIVGIVVGILVVVVIAGIVYKKKMANNSGSSSTDHGDLA